MPVTAVVARQNRRVKLKAFAYRRVSGKGQIDNDDVKRHAETTRVRLR